MNDTSESCSSKLNYYFDNAATSWPKPEKVYRAPEKQMRHACGNPGRSGHTRTLEADRLLYRTREAVAKLFNVGDPARIVFALNATDALNIAIKGCLSKGDHAIYTAMEHNSVLRPLGGLQRNGFISATMVPCSEKGYPDLEFLESAYQAGTRLLVINHASNVTGSIAPLEAMVKSAHKHNVIVLVDAAQTAGSHKIDAAALGIDMIAFTGHKSLLGPTGTGGLYVRRGLDLKPLREGGTGSQSELDQHPQIMPERLEAGTLNNAGLAGLLEGLKFINSKGIETIQAHEQKLRSYLYNRLKELPNVKTYGPSSDEPASSIISFTINNTDCGEIGFILENNYGILCRTGLHCAPLAHKAIGTFPQGTVRLSPGYFTTNTDVDYLIGALFEITKLAL